MTDRATLEALLNRVLEGTGPDRELDAEIACAVNGFTMHEDSNPGDGHFAFWHGKPWESLCSNCSGWPHYTGPGLDAALTLLPEGRDWHVQSNPSAGACWASISPAKHDLKLREWGSGMMKAATPARAIIAACIKARMEAQGE